MATDRILSVSGRLGRLLVTLLGHSWSIAYARPSTGRSGTVRDRPVLFSFWHGRQLPLIFTHRGEGVVVLVSRHRDGQYVTNVLESMGFGTVRGSSSRGGLEALRGMSKVLREGRDGAVTPDGPRGPAERAAEGLAVMARLGGRPVVAMGTSGWPRVRFRSWDRFLLPLPFARMTVVEGRPVAVGSGGSGGDGGISLERLEAEMRRVTALADFLADPVCRAQSALVSLTTSAARAAARCVLAISGADREERRERRGILDRSRRHDCPVWLHGASMGEIRGLLPVAELIIRRDVPVHMTCMTRSARKLLRERGGAVESSFVPLDSKRWVRRFLSTVRPRLLVLAETELWPVLLRETALAGVPIVIVNARLSRERMHWYGMFSGYLGRLLSSCVGIVCRSADDAARFLRLGVDEACVGVGSDTKAVSHPGDPPAEWREQLHKKGMPVLVAGSTREGEEEPVVHAARQAGFLPLVAPRHLSRVDEVVGALRDRLGLRLARWSESGPDLSTSPDCLVVDVQGILGALYGAGDVAFVGGSIAPLGGHNILEPLQHGVPVVIGPHHDSFSNEVGILDRTGWVAVGSTPDELSRAMKEMIANGPDRQVLLEKLAEMGSRTLPEVERLLDLAIAPKGR